MRALVTGAVLALLAATTACGAGSGTAAAGSGSGAAAAGATAAPAGTRADAATRGLAEVEFLRQCTVAATAFVDEADITADLDGRLAAAGFTHQEWKDWRDALVDSPALVDQLGEVGAAGCPAG